MISFPRRLAVLFYDSISVFVLIYFASFLPVILTQQIIVAGSFEFQAFLLLITLGYFTYCWRQGQTFGMKAWRVYLRSINGRKPSFIQLLTRFGVASISLLAFGLGYFYALVDLSRKTWHDQASGTYLIHIASSNKSILPGDDQT